MEYYYQSKKKSIAPKTKIFGLTIKEVLWLIIIFGLILLSGYRAPLP